MAVIFQPVQGHFARKETEHLICQHRMFRNYDTVAAVGKSERVIRPVSFDHYRHSLQRNSAAVAHDTADSHFLRKCRHCGQQHKDCENYFLHISNV